jgi:hypothetical protein
MLGSLIRRRRQVTASMAGITIATVGLCGLAPAQQPPSEAKASALLLIAREQPSILPQSVVKADKEEFEAFRQNQAVLIKSRIVLGAALRNPKVAELKIVKDNANVLAWLEKEIAIELPERTTFMRVSLKGPQPEKLVLIVSAVVDSYFNEIVNKERDKRIARLDQLKVLAVNYEKQLRVKRQTLRGLVEDLGKTLGKIWPGRMCA